MKKSTTDKINGITSAAVQKATGKSWTQWLKILDKAGAGNWPHQQTAEFLYDHHGVAGSWAQTVTTGFEQARGLRARHAAPAGGFEISVNRTIAAPVSKAFEAWRDPVLREQWLAHAPLTVRKATPHKSIRITWGDGTSVSINFWPKGPLKCQVVPEHSKLPDADTAEAMKTYWTGKLEALKLFLEKP
ncbi:MAG: hypothetical protein PHQ04_01495 [Opitutaceae bacterium]|nr:hypothetical protein [Opitutaceae bacterium]